MIYTFYSYKGGVGRSMALVNIAELMCRAGLRVLMVDWDLEAPGLERFYPDQVEQVLESPGIIDMLLDYKDESSRYKPEPRTPLFPVYEIKDYLIGIHIDPDGPGELWLLPAGRRAKNQFVAYSNQVKMFDWQDFYQYWEGEIYFDWLHEEFEKFADVVLIDSRTGVTEMSGVCTYQLADVVVMFCGANEQSIDGTLQMAKNFSGPQLQKLRCDRPLRTLIVPSRIERISETESLNDFRQKFARGFAPYTPDEFRAEPDFFLQLEIPYIPLYAFEEIIAVNQISDKRRSVEMEEAYKKLLQTLAVLAPEDSSIREHLQVRKKKPKMPTSVTFILSHPVPPSHFIGRQREVSHILSRLANPVRGSSAISGDPLVGKTSLLHYLGEPQMREAWGLSPSRCHFLYLDCHNIVPFSETAFWHFTLRELEEHVSDDETLRRTVQRLLEQPDLEAYDLDRLFDQIARAARLAVLLLDEFDRAIENLDRHSPDLLYHLRALLNRRERGLALLIASREPLKQLCAGFRFAGSPFDNAFSAITLLPFSEAEVDELLVRYQVDLSATERTFLRQMAGTHPYLVQLTAWLIVRAHTEQAEAEIPLAPIEAELEQETEGYFSEIFHYSSEAEQMLLTWLALCPLSQHLPAVQTGLGSPPRAFGRYEQVLEHLVKRGLVLKQTEGPILFSPIFARWILRKVVIAGGWGTLSRWEPYYADFLSPVQKEALEDLVDKVIRQPAVVKTPELLVQLPSQDEDSLLTSPSGKRVLGRYIIVEGIGGGGMADIFRAYDPRLDRPVVVKRLRPTLSGEEEVRARFQREVQALAGLRHPHIVQVYDFGIEENHYYMVMEFIDGYDLQQHLNNLQAAGQTLSWEESLRIAACVADALDYAHQREMIHRDVKPSNILLTNDGGVFLTDFGLVRLLDQAGLTQAGAFLGTLAYMAPELIEGAQTDQRSDIYSLGVVLYEMATGHLPFRGRTPIEIIKQQLEGPPPAPSSINPVLPHAVDTVVLKAMAFDRNDRYSSVGELADALRKAV